MNPFNQEQVTGLNEPNIMTPGAWIIISIVGACIIAGGVWMFFKYWTTIRVPWNGLAGYRQAAVYVEPGNTTYNAARLVAALQKSEELLKQYTKYTAEQFEAALQKICVYVKKDDAWKDGSGTKVAGLDPEGTVVVVGANFAALLHEMAHQLEDIAEKFVDYDHKTWASKGFDVADAAFQEWLKTASV